MPRRPARPAEPTDADAPIDANIRVPHPPVTPSATRRTAADRDLGAPGANAEARLDETIEESFPASDPPSSSVIE